MYKVEVILQVIVALFLESKTNSTTGKYFLIEIIYMKSYTENVMTAWSLITKKNENAENFH